MPFCKVRCLGRCDRPGSVRFFYRPFVPLLNVCPIKRDAPAARKRKMSCIICDPMMMSMRTGFYINSFQGRSTATDSDGGGGGGVCCYLLLLLLPVKKGWKATSELNAHKLIWMQHYSTALQHSTTTDFSIIVSTCSQEEDRQGLFTIYFPPRPTFCECVCDLLTLKRFG